MLKREMNIADYDEVLWAAMEKEVVRQEEHIELIASENYTSPRVMQAQGSQLTNKYAEGYPGKRYYGGCEYVDIVEQLAIDRAKELFGADFANVQPHSGSQANFAVYTALLQPGDTILGMNLGHGGHLTHGSPANLSGKLYNVVPYGIDETGDIDYEDVKRQAEAHKPKMIIGGFSAFSGIVDWANYVKSLTALVPTYSSTWHTLLALSPQAFTLIRCHTHTSSPQPRTKRWLAHAVV